MIFGRIVSNIKRINQVTIRKPRLPDAGNITKETMMTNVISNERLDELLAASPAERVTKEYMESRIVHSPVFTRIGGTVTHCRIVLDNGFSVSGESACVNEENYNQEIGEKIAYDNAFRQLWPLFGFLLAERNKLAGGRGVSGSTAQAA